MIFACYLAGMPFGALHGYASAWVDNGNRTRCLFAAGLGALSWPLVALVPVARLLDFDVDPVRTVARFARGERRWTHGWKW